VKLTSRLEKVAKYINNNSVIADVGTDHAYLPISLVKNKVIKKAIASDVGEGPLMMAQKMVDKYKMNDNIDLRLGNGLNVLNVGEVDTVIIAGMGGNLIAELLEDGKEIAKSIETFIFQPMQYSEVLREYLYNNGYNIIEESLAKEGKKYYQIIKAIHGEKILEDPMYLFVGKELFINKDKLLKEYLKVQLDKKLNILNKIGNASNGNEKIIGKLEKEIEWYRNKISVL